MHISKDITGSRGNDLAGRKIVLCLTGSVAVLRFMEVARGLMRLGADVFPVMTQAACGLVTPELVHWATGNKPVTRLSGQVEHVELAGNVAGKADLILIAPATANTIGKIACGIDDTPVTTVATTALGEGIPVLIVPAMHLPMYQHAIVKENMRKLAGIGVRFIEPRLEEGKAKLAEVAVIINDVVNLMAKSRSLAGKKLLITAGPTFEYIDPVRIVTNRSSGKMGIALAKAALGRGGQVTLVYGPGSEPPPAGVKLLRVQTTAEMHKAVTGELTSDHYDMVIAAAAVSDWTVADRAEAKISTHGKDSLSLQLKPTIKIIDQIRKTAPGVILVCFRALTGLSDQQLVEDGYRRLTQARADFIVVNDVSRQGVGFDVDTNEVIVVDKRKHYHTLPLETKQQVAEGILDLVWAD